MHLHRDQLLGISQNIYAHKLFVANIQHQRYQEYLDRALRERIKSNSEFFSGQLNDSVSNNQDGFNKTKYYDGADEDEPEFRRLSSSANISLDDLKKAKKRVKQRSEIAIEDVDALLWQKLEPLEEKKRSHSKFLTQTKKLSFDYKHVTETRSEERALLNSRKNHTR